MHEPATISFTKTLQFSNAPIHQNLVTTQNPNQFHNFIITVAVAIRELSQFKTLHKSQPPFQTHNKPHEAVTTATPGARFTQAIQPQHPFTVQSQHNPSSQPETQNTHAIQMHRCPNSC